MTVTEQQGNINGKLDVYVWSAGSLKHSMMMFSESRLPAPPQLYRDLYQPDLFFLLF